jgi:threonyl-tRNA synthetase
VRETTPTCSPFDPTRHTLQKVPYLLVVGDKEIETQTVAVRARRGDDLGSMSLEQLEKHLTDDVSRRGCVLLEN